MQWAVYPNPSARLRDEIPFLVDLQSNLLRGLATRLVAPLARTGLGFDGLPRRLCPLFTIDGATVVMLPHEVGPIDARLLKRPVSTLDARAHELIDALDAVMSGV